MERTYDLLDMQGERNGIKVFGSSNWVVEDVIHQDRFIERGVQVSFVWGLLSLIYLWPSK